MHENDPFYDNTPQEIPYDLAPHYRQFKPGCWAYVCPCCKTVYPPGLAGMPGSFRTHIVDVAAGGGCFFNPKARPLASMGGKHTKDAAGF